MDSQSLTKGLKKLPDTPGVYFFLKMWVRADRNADKRRLPRQKDVLYIGRATSLRNRVRSYFAPDIAEKRSSWIAKMLPLIKSIDFRKTDSVLEAALLEADLIKKFQPPYNTDEKDDKSFNCVVISGESFPSVFIARQKDIDFSSLRIKDKGLKILRVYGPYPAGFHLQTAMKIIRRIFPYRDAKCTPPTEQVRPHQQHPDKLEFIRMCRPCFSRQIGLCPGVCTGEISKKEYAKTIRNLRLFFEGKKARLLKLIEREMKTAAKRQEFEKAGELKRQLFALRHIQDIALLKRASVSVSVLRSRSASVQRTLRIEAYDLSHFGSKEIVGAMAVVEDGAVKPNEYRLFKLRGITRQHEVAGLQEIIRRRFTHPEWSFPQLIVVDGNEVQKRAAGDAIHSIGFSIPVVAVVKDERHKPREIVGFHRHSNILQNVGMSWRDTERVILLANAEAHRFVLKFQQNLRSL